MKHLSLNTKMMLVMGIFCVGALAIAAISIFQLRSVNESMTKLVNVYAVRVNLANHLESLGYSIRNEEKVLVLEEDPAAMKKIADKIDTIKAEVDEELKKYDAVAAEAGKANLATLRQLLGEWVGVHARLREHAFKNQHKEATALARGESKAVLEKFDGVLDEMATRNEKRMTDEAAANDALVSRTFWLIGSVSLVALVSGILCAFFILRSMNQAIEKVISNLLSDSAHVASAATQIAASSDSLSQASSEQAASLQQTTASVEEMSSMVQKNAENSQRSSSVAGTSRDNAVRGKEVVNDMIRAIGEINESNEAIMRQIDQSNREISEIVKVITEIGSKTKVINDIVFQTKLLSFNASVEAARAGEHGKGFAVVAEEVGNLAQMSGNAAQEIGSMLEGSIQKVEGIVTNTKVQVERLVLSARQKVDNGRQIAETCGETLDQIVNNVDSVSRMADEISSASREQAQGVTEINKAISQLDQVTQTNASASQQAASSAEQLSSQAQSLKNVVSELVLIVRGATDAHGSSNLSVAAHSSHRQSTSAAPLAKPIHLSQSRKASAKSKSAGAGSAKPLKKAAGGYESSAVPSENDKRFEDF